jgi:hypothetical protein
VFYCLKKEEQISSEDYRCLTPVILRKQRAGGSQFTRPYLEKTLHKKMVGGVAQGICPEFKSQYHKKKNKRGTWIVG